MTKRFGFFNLATFIIWGAVLSAGFTQAAWAQKAYVGGLVGMSVPDYSHTSARPMFGVDAGARFDGEWGLGAYYLSSSKEESNAGTKFDFNYKLYGIEGTYHLEGVADNAYFAVKAGMSKITAGSAEVSPFSWGLGFGYDFPLKDIFSLGVQAGFMSVNSGEDGGTTVKSFTMLNFLLAARFWF